MVAVNPTYQWLSRNAAQVPYTTNTVSPKTVRAGWSHHLSLRRTVARGGPPRAPPMTTGVTEGGGCTSSTTLKCGPPCPFDLVLADRRRQSLSACPPVAGRARSSLVEDLSHTFTARTPRSNAPRPRSRTRRRPDR